MIGAPVLHRSHLLFPTEEPTPIPEFNSTAKEHECAYLLRRCKNTEEFIRVHAQIIKLGLTSTSSFPESNVLATCALSGWENGMDYACSVFQTIEDPGTFEFNTMIRGYVKEMNFEKALMIYKEMVETGLEPDSFTHPFLLKACAWVKGLEEGKQIHGHVFKFGLETDIYVQNSLINMYGRCGEIKPSNMVFENINSKTVASWSSNIAVYAGLGMWWDCLSLFREMRKDRDLKPEESTLVSILSAFTYLGDLEIGKCTHGFLLRNISELNTIVGTSLVDMYAKCGCLDKATSIFKKMEKKNKLTYSAMITGLALHGRGQEALKVSSDMLREGLKPDDVVYVGVLSACSHSGLVKEGLEVFERMVREKRVEPTIQHYGCMVDLMGRAGFLREALDFIKSMPFEPNDVVWRSFLSSCRIHQNVELGEMAAANLIRLNSNNPSDYLMISNMYAQAQRWESVARIRTKIAKKGFIQTPGCCVVEAKGKMHKFVSQDKSHPQGKEIYEMINQIEWQLKFEGYLPDTSQVLLNVDEGEKRERLKGHSQKLAIAFTLMHSSPGSVIRISRNLRMCTDCHAYTKKISTIFEREIVVKDKNRFHHFKGGSCSCKDYW